MPVAEPDDPAPIDLTLFQHEILYILGKEGTLYGLAIKDRLEDRYGEPQNHGRLYPNLNQLSEVGLITKEKRDDRTNDYSLTKAGKRVLRRDAQRRYNIADSLTGRFGGDA